MKTAVDWQSDQLNKLDDDWKKERIDGKEYTVMKYRILKIAKEIEKEQIEDAFQDGKWDWEKHITNQTESKDLAQYYNEKYKQKDIDKEMSQHNWIPLKDKKPESDGTYLTYIKTKTYESISFTQFFDGQFMSSFVTHWQIILKPNI